jgi:thiamine-monophosphate kinase
VSSFEPRFGCVMAVQDVRGWTETSVLRVRPDAGQEATVGDATEKGGRHPAEGSVEHLGELALVDLISNLCAQSEAGNLDLVGIGDDAAVVAAPDRRVVVSADMAVAGRHFRTDWSDARHIGVRVAAANLADIAAMGAQPTNFLLSLGLPRSTEVSWVLDLVRGVVAETMRAGAVVAGGDVVGAQEIIVAGTALGDLAGRSPVRRSGAVAGDQIAVAGRLGWAAAGLAVLTRGFRSPRALVDAHRQPEPPYQAGVQAGVSGAHAMIDVSDGLLLDAARIARASMVEIDIESALITVAEPIAAAAAAYNLDPLQWILGGGDDHAFLAAFAPDAPLPDGFTRIGQVRAHTSAMSAMADGANPVTGWVTVDGKTPEGSAGYAHFS